MAAVRPSQADGAARGLGSLLWLFGVSFTVALAFLCVYVFAVEPHLMVARQQSNAAHLHELRSTPFLTPGMDRPPTIPAADAKLADEARVLGVEAGGKARAYELAALRSPIRQVINDMYNDVPITLTYCETSGCARAFTADQRGEPLRLGVGGLARGELLVTDQSVFYFQRTGKAMAPGVPDLPYPTHAVRVCTWKEWRDAHPDTDLFAAPAVIASETSTTPEPLVHPRYRQQVP
jgi:hypothetical protein